MTYGYEVFNFNISRDESNAGIIGADNFARAWLEQQRWGMAALTALLPPLQTPAVSTLLGLLLSTASWWLIARYVLELGPWQTTGAVSIAATGPCVALMTAFSTTVLGIGVGQVLVFAFAVSLSRPGLRHVAVAVTTVAFAMAMYDTLIFSCALMVALVALKNRNWLTALTGTVIVACGAVVSRIMGLVINILLDVQTTGYKSFYLDIPGLLSSPVARLSSGFRDGLSPMLITNQRFGVQAPWLWVLYVVLILSAIVPIIRQRGTKSITILQLSSLGALLASPGLAAAASANPIPLRSNVFIPIVWLGLSYMVFSPASTGPRQIGEEDHLRHTRDLHGQGVLAAVLGLLMTFAVLSQSLVSSRLLAATDTALSHDRFLAFSIEETRSRLAGRDNSVPLVMYAERFNWQNNPLTPTVDVSGSSLMSEGAIFLKGQGVNVNVPTAREKKRGDALLRSMPIYPATGWIAYRDGLLLVKLNDEPLP